MTKKKTGGRQKGTPNKVTKQMTDMVRESLDDAGGKDYLIWLSQNHPNAYAGILKSIIPKQIQAEISETVSLTPEEKKLRLIELKKSYGED